MPEARLTARQAQVVGLVARGNSNKEIAAALGITERAVKAHVSDLLAKFDVPNRAGLIATVMTSAGFGLAAESRPGRGAIALQAGLPSAEDELALYDLAPFMVSVTTGASHIYRFVNRISARVAGRPAGALVGKPVAVAYPDLAPGFREALDGVFRTGQPWAAARAPVRFTHDDGTYRD